MRTTILNRSLALAHAAALSAMLAVAPIAAYAANESIDGNLLVGGSLTVTGAILNPGGASPAFSWPRNLIDNGGMLVQQRGTGVVTAATTAGCAITSYAADRWCADVNVTSGAGQLTPITSSPTPPAGFQQALKLARNSGALTQPQCAWQEIRSDRVAAAAGQPVMLSAQIAALAGLAADNGNAAQMVIITGTTADQGLGALRSAVGMTASPAITPAWTGLATLQTTPVALTTSFARFNGVAVTMPSAALEAAVAICFTPTATGAGATDGLAFTGVQLEIVAAGATAPSAYEFKPTSMEVLAAQRNFYSITEAAQSGATQSPSGQGASTTTCTLYLPFPVTMDVIPTFQAYGTALGTGTWTITHVVTASALATTFLVTQASAGNTVNGAGMTATTGAVLTVGQTCVLTSANGGSILGWSADF